MARGFRKRRQAAGIAEGDMEQAEGQMPIVKSGLMPEVEPDELPQFTHEQAKEQYGDGGKARYCVNCEHLNFDSVYGLYRGACKLRPRKESRVEMDFTCEEFEMA